MMLARQERKNDFGQGIAEFCMLIQIHVHSVNYTGGGDTLRVKESALEIGSHTHVCIRETRASLLGAAKFRGDAALRSAYLRRANYQDGRHRHSWLYRRLPHLINKCSYSLCC